MHIFLEISSFELSGTYFEVNMHRCWNENGNKYNYYLDNTPFRHHFYEGNAKYCRDRRFFGVRQKDTTCHIRNWLRTFLAHSAEDECEGAVKKEEIKVS